MLNLTFILFAYSKEERKILWLKMSVILYLLYLLSGGIIMFAYHPQLSGAGFWKFLFSPLVVAFGVFAPVPQRMESGEIPGGRLEYYLKTGIKKTCIVIGLILFISIFV
jgi:hypothetical protein